MGGCGGVGDRLNAGECCRRRRLDYGGGLVVVVGQRAIAVAPRGAGAGKTEDSCSKARSLGEQCNVLRHIIGGGQRECVLGQNGYGPAPAPWDFGYRAPTCTEFASCADRSPTARRPLDPSRSHRMRGAHLLRRPHGPAPRKLRPPLTRSSTAPPAWSLSSLRHADYPPGTLESPDGATLRVLSGGRSPLSRSR